MRLVEQMDAQIAGFAEKWFEFAAAPDTEEGYKQKAAILDGIVASAKLETAPDMMSMVYRIYGAGKSLDTH